MHFSLGGEASQTAHAPPGPAERAGAAPRSGPAERFGPARQTPAVLSEGVRSIRARRGAFTFEQSQTHLMRQPWLMVICRPGSQAPSVIVGGAAGAASLWGLCARGL